MRGPTNFRAFFPMLLFILALLPLIQPAPLLLRDESLLTANWKNLMSSNNLPSSTGLEAGTVARLASSNFGSETKKWNQHETGSEATRDWNQNQVGSEEARPIREWNQLPASAGQLRRVKKTGESTRHRLNRTQHFLLSKGLSLSDWVSHFYFFLHWETCDLWLCFWH